jgi:hypothetical protein
MKILLIFLSFFVSSASSQTVPRLSTKATQRYLSELSSMLAGRPLSSQELSLIESGKQDAIIEIINAWSNGAYLAESAKIMTQTQLSASGTAGGINYEFPGDLARYIVKNQRPYSEIITADFCVNSAEQRVPCDTGAPFNAGVLTTKAFLVKSAGRFNLGRAGRLLREFACRSYPMEANVQVPVAKPRLIPMFQVNSGGAEDFGNGTGCYTCHSQFGAHAQFFVKFDAFGVYQASASGQQNPSLEMGKSVNNLYTSHYSNPAEAASESSQMFGQEVPNLREAAKVLASSDIFLACAVRNTIKHVLKMNDSEVRSMSTDLVNEIAKEIKAINPNPTWPQIVAATFKSTKVINSVLQSGGGE